MTVKQVPVLHDRKAKLFPKRKRSKRRPLFLQTKWPSSRRSQIRWWWGPGFEATLLLDRSHVLLLSFLLRLNMLNFESSSVVPTKLFSTTSAWLCPCRDFIFSITGIFIGLQPRCARIKKKEDASTPPSLLWWSLLNQQRPSMFWWLQRAAWLRSSFLYWWSSWYRAIGKSRFEWSWRSARWSLSKKRPWGKLAAARCTAMWTNGIPGPVLPQCSTLIYGGGLTSLSSLHSMQTHLLSWLVACVTTCWRVWREPGTWRSHSCSVPPWTRWCGPTRSLRSTCRFWRASLAMCTSLLCPSGWPVVMSVRVPWLTWRLLWKEWERTSSRKKQATRQRSLAFVPVPIKNIKHTHAQIRKISSCSPTTSMIQWKESKVPSLCIMTTAV